jgi:hypothetical protein
LSRFSSYPDTPLSPDRIGDAVVAVHLPQRQGQGAGPLAAGGIAHCGVQLAHTHTHTHTSELLEKLVAQAPDGPVDLDWLLGHLDKRSFGLLLLLLGLLVIVPGVASIACLIVLFPSVEMMLGRSRPVFPQFLSKRPFDFERFKRLAERVQPALRTIENLSRPRWTLPRAVASRLIGAVVFLLALSAVWPLPLVNVIPGAIIVLMAIAYLQEDGLLLTVAATAAFLSLAGFGWTLWTSGGAVMRWIGHS